MTCEWKECSNEATRVLFRPVEGVKKDANKRRIWNENLSVCETCLAPAQLEYRYQSFVHPDTLETHSRPGCFR